MAGISCILLVKKYPKYGPVNNIAIIGFSSKRTKAGATHIRPILGVNQNLPGALRRRFQANNIIYYIMSKPKVLIVGGGVGGLSCATALADTGKFDIHLYESDIIGGQASSKKSKLCNTEISWRVWGNYYHNLNTIIEDIKSKDNFYPFKGEHFCINNNSTSTWSANSYETLINIIKNNNFTQINKIFEICFINRYRAINEYNDITTREYFNNNFVDMIAGPYFGLEPSKVTVSSYYKTIFALYDNNVPNSGGIVKYPTSDALFNPWKIYLTERGVKIHEKHEMNDICTDSNGNISNVIINNNKYEADEIVFACSLKPLLNVFNNNFDLKKTLIREKLNILKGGQQFYASVNLYWKKTVINGSKCHIYSTRDGWTLMIIKKFIDTDYVKNNCNKNIKEVWNVGVADYLPGKYIDKFSSQCSLDEIIYEIKMNLINSPHFNNIGLNENTWNDLFYDYEIDDRYKKKLPASEKFSINKGIEENLLKNHEPELGKNIYFSAYYVKNSVGGASMETSCEIGLTTADLICKKYNYDNLREPVLKTNMYLYLFLLPFVLLDFILYKLQLRPITDFIYPLVLLVIYLVILLILLYKLITFTYKTLNTKSKFFRRLYKPLL
jgi:hypothetical protein